MFFRKKERPRLWFRNGRIFCSEGLWYFCTREGLNVGPYHSKGEAVAHTARLVEILAQLENEDDAMRWIREYMANPMQDVDYGASPEDDERIDRIG